MLVLGIESSCDETAAALVEDGRTVHSNVVASQIDTHRRFGGVVPELASREHLRNIGYVVWRAFREAGKQYSEIDGIAVTQGPGLIGSHSTAIPAHSAFPFPRSATAALISVSADSRQRRCATSSSPPSSRAGGPGARFRGR